MYGEALNAFNLHFSAIARGQREDAQASFHGFVDKLMLLQVYGSKGVLEKARNLTDAVKKYRAARFGKGIEQVTAEDRLKIFDAVKMERRSWIVQMRADCSGDNINNADEVIEVFSLSERKEDSQ